MGNCVIREERVHWGGEDWDLSFSSSPASQIVFSGTSSGRENIKTTATTTPTAHRRRRYNQAASSSRKEEETDDLLQKHRRREDDDSSSSSSSSTLNSNKAAAVKEVKIKITKKQLEELLGEVRVEGMSIQQVVHQLMKAGDHYETTLRSWRPNLKSIPE